MKNQLVITRASSNGNGIRFYSQKSPKMYVNAFCDGKRIRSDVCKETEIRMSILESFVLFCFGIILAVVLFTAKMELILVLWRTFLVASITALLFIVAEVRSEGKRNDMFRFHAAEHMVVNCFNSLGKIPTISEVEKCSKFSNRCGTNRFTIMFIMIVVAFISSFLPILNATIVMIASFVILIALRRIGALNFVQSFFTESPGEIHYKVAIEGVKQWLMFEYSPVRKR